MSVVAEAKTGMGKKPNARKQASYSFAGRERGDVSNIDFNVRQPSSTVIHSWYSGLSGPARIEPGLSAAWTQYHSGITVKKSAGLTAVSYSFRSVEIGDVSNPALARTSGITFEVAPPTSGSSAPPTTPMNLVTDAGNVPALDPLTDASGNQLTTA